MARDPHNDWGPTWDDPIGQLRLAQAKVRRLEGENARLRERITELEAAEQAAETGLCHAAIHDGRDGRVGLRSLWNAWFGAKAVRP